ncbi:MAG: DUF4430 domain-containing protein [Clostridia bacterium]|nr:DUF4430 domain-containing protein [Clostridia bacterium]
MKKRNFVFRICTVIISFVLIAVMAFIMTSCGKEAAVSEPSSEAVTEPAQTKESGDKTISFTFSVTGADGTIKAYAVSTDKTTLGEALLEEGIINEDEQKTGFISTVNGVTLNWDTDKAYWALYVGTELAQKGVNETEITDGGDYSFVYTKG